jgi:hypothetical protein
MNKIYIGIDPGKTGGIASIQNGIFFVSSLDSTNENEVLARMIGYIRQKPNEVLFTLEHVSPSPKQGSSAAFHYGRGLGYIKGLIEAHGHEILMVRPAVWKMALRLGRDKKESIELCHKLYPETKSTIYLQKHDGPAEALLLAHYGMLFDKRTK